MLIWLTPANVCLIGNRGRHTTRRNTMDRRLKVFKQIRSLGFQVIGILLLFVIGGGALLLDWIIN